MIGVKLDHELNALWDAIDGIRGARSLIWEAIAMIEDELKAIKR